MTGQNIVIDFTAVNNVNKNDWQDYLKYFNTDYEIVSKTEYYPIQRFLYRTLKYIRPKK